MRRQMMFNKLKQKIHSLHLNDKEERIRLEAKQEILSVITNELGLDADGDIFTGVRSSSRYATFYVDALNGIFEAIKPHQYNSDIVGDDRSRMIENYESM